MASKLKAPIALGDTVAIFPRQMTMAPKPLKTAIVTYVGRLHIRLDDRSSYASLGLTSLWGNAGTRIERVPC
jgi:hypothetical protein